MTSATAPVAALRGDVCILVSTAPSAPAARQFERCAIDMAAALGRRGHRVTIAVSLPDPVARDGIAAEIAGLVPAGVTVVGVPDPQVPPSLGPLAREVQQSYAAHEWLKTHPFDVVYADDRQAVPYFAQLGRLLAASGRATRYVVELAGPEIWRRLEDRIGVRELPLLVRFDLEQNVVERADRVILPSAAMAEWTSGHGYRIDPDKVSVIPQCLGEGLHSTSAGQSAPPRELVFVGPPTARGGFMLFCRMAALLADRCEDIARVTFLLDQRTLSAASESAAREVLGPELAARAEFRPTPPVEQVLDYLADHARLAVIPNMGAAGDVLVSAILLRGLPVLVGCRGSARELIDPAARDALLLDENPNRAVRTLAAAIASGVPVGVATAGLSGALSARVALIEEEIAAARAEPDGRIVLGDDPPLVTVCLMHFNRPGMVGQAIDSVRRQTYPKLDVVLVDDGSTDPDVPALLDSLETEFGPKGWRVVRQENLYLGAARNTAARNARGDFLFYLDDDNVAKPHAVETFVKAALASDARIITCFSEAFTGEELPDETRPADRRIIQVGPALAYGLFHNSFGDGNAFINRDTFLSLGGNSELWGIGKDDQEFFARALLAGHTLWVLPEALFWARQLASRLRHRHYDWYSGHVRVLDTYLKGQPSYLRNLLALCQGLGTSSPSTVNSWEVGVSEDDLRRLASGLTGSLSWRLTAPLHDRFYDVIDRDDTLMTLPLRSTPETAPWHTILRVLSSYSWELTAPLRLPVTTARLAARFLSRRVRRPDRAESEETE